MELLCKRYGKEIVHLEDSKGRRPLHVAALMGHVMCANLLLEAGAEVEAVDIEGRTALIVAAQFGQSLVAGKRNLIKRKTVRPRVFIAVYFAICF